MLLVVIEVSLVVILIVVILIIDVSGQKFAHQKSQKKSLKSSSECPLEISSGKSTGKVAILWKNTVEILWQSFGNPLEILWKIQWKSGNSFPVAILWKSTGKVAIHWNIPLEIQDDFWGADFWCATFCPYTSIISITTINVIITITSTTAICCRLSGCIFLRWHNNPKYYVCTSTLK